MKHFKIAVLAGTIVVVLIFLFVYIHDILVLSNNEKNSTIWYSELDEKNMNYMKFFRKEFVFANNISEKSEQVINCRFTDIMIESAKYNNSDKKLYVTIKNNGNNISLVGLTVIGNSVVFLTPEMIQEGILSGETKTYSISIENGCIDIYSVRMETECLGGRDVLKKSNEEFTFIGC